jgi:O-acetyl-ADP-ribose deacetylase (regulator of RNase III)
MPVTVVQDDLLAQDVDVIVNAANTHMEHMGGIAGLIAGRAGLDLVQESKAKRPVATGGAILTTAGRLPQKGVIHAVGPIWNGGDYAERALLWRAHRSVFELVRDHGFESVGIPAISCGIFGFPVEEAAPLAMDCAYHFVSAHPEVEVRFCLFSDDHMEAFSKRLREG